MTHESDNTQDDRLDHLLMLLVEEGLTDGQRNELAERLCDDEEAQDRYVDYISLHSWLDWDCPKSPTESQSETETSPRTMSHPVLGFLADCGKQAREFVTNPTPLSLVVAFLVVVSSVVALSMISVGEGDVDNVAAIQQAEPRSVARLSRLQNCIWTKGTVTRNHDDSLFEGDTLNLAQGEVRIEYHTGVKVLLQGPACFRIEGNNGGLLSQGKLTARVPPLASGFTVDTRHARVVDMGTEFGVQVDKTQVVSVHVFEGRVEVALKNKAAKKQILLAKESLRIGPSGTLPNVVLEGKQFVRLREATFTEEHRRWLKYSRKLRQDPSLVAYYTFERAGAGRRLVNQSAATRGTLNGVLGDGRRPTTSPSWSTGRWAHKGALRFRSQLSQRVLVPLWSQANIDQAITLAAWIKPNQNTGYMMIVSQWDKVGGDKNSYYLALRDLEGKFQGRGLPLWGRVSEEGKVGMTKNESDDGTLTRMQDGWVHVALTIQSGGGPVRLYKNGGEVDADGLTFGAAKLPNHEKPLSIGAKVYSVGEANFFNGWIDELAIFRRALSAQDIREMYQEGY